jgi:hypothetical protein
MICQRWQWWVLLSAAASIVSASPLGLGGVHVPATTPAHNFIHTVAAINGLDLHLVVYNNIPRGGGGSVCFPQNRVSEQDNPMENNHHCNTGTTGTTGGDIDDRVTLPLPKRLLTVAKIFVGRTTNLLFFRSRRQQEQGIHLSQLETEDNVNEDHSFDELDSIIENNTSIEVTQQLREDASINVDSNNNLPSWPKLPRGLSSLTGGWKERTFRHWINQVCSL